MTPEREQYLEQCNVFEQDARGKIIHHKWLIKLCKEDLNENEKLTAAEVLETKQYIATHKRYVSMLKRQLPQSLPPGKLKRCPFCGGKAEVGFYTHSGYYVICQNCGAITVHRYTVEEVVKAWNRRRK